MLVQAAVVLPSKHCLLESLDGRRFLLALFCKKKKNNLRKLDKIVTQELHNFDVYIEVVDMIVMKIISY